MVIDARQGTRRASVTGTGAVHWSPAYGYFTMKLPGFHVQMTFDGPHVYVPIPPRDRARLGGAHWAEIPASSLTTGPISYDPTETLKVLAGQATSIVEVGTDNIDGVKATRYDAQVDLRKAYGGDQTQFNKVEQLIGTTSVPMTVWIDAAGRPRKFQMTLRALHPPPDQPALANLFPIIVTLSVNFSHYGIPVRVTPPNRNQVASISLQQLQAVLQ